jgi:hypothetical protein
VKHPGINRTIRFTAQKLHSMGMFPFPLKPHNSSIPNAFKQPQSWGWQWQALGCTENSHVPWDRAPWPNLGLWLLPSNLVCLDSDTPEAEVWAQANLSETPWVTRTARGKHRYYRLVAPSRVPTDNKPFPGLDRKARGYVLAPGSWHFSGEVEYEPEGDWEVLYLPSREPRDGSFY